MYTEHGDTVSPLRDSGAGAAASGVLLFYRAHNNTALTLDLKFLATSTRARRLRKPGPLYTIVSAAVCYVLNRVYAMGGGGVPSLCGGHTNDVTVYFIGGCVYLF